jgi:hypothetical protein
MTQLDRQGRSDSRIKSSVAAVEFHHDSAQVPRNDQLVHFSNPPYSVHGSQYSARLCAEYGLQLGELSGRSGRIITCTSFNAGRVLLRYQA